MPHPDFLDSATENEAKEVDAALQENSERLRRMSLQKSIDVCEVCNGKISKARQKAMPGVQTCIKCAEELEKS